MLRVVVNKLAYRELQGTKKGETFFTSFIYIHIEYMCVWLREQASLKRERESAKNQFISINLSKHLYRLRFLSFTQIHFFFYPNVETFTFYNQFSSCEFVRAQELKFPFFSLHSDLIKRICFMSILIELLGELEKWETGSGCFFIFSPSIASNPIVPHISLSNEILLCLYGSFWQFYVSCMWQFERRMLKMLIKESHLVWFSLTEIDSFCCLPFAIDTLASSLAGVRIRVKLIFRAWCDVWEYLKGFNIMLNIKTK
jgi:hypothetical protein